MACKLSGCAGTTSRASASTPRRATAARSGSGSPTGRSRRTRRRRHFDRMNRMHRMVNRTRGPGSPVSRRPRPVHHPVHPVHPVKMPSPSPLICLVLAHLAVAGPAHAQTRPARFQAAFFAGTAWSLPTRLVIRQRGEPDIRLRARYAPRPWRDAPYYAYRLGYAANVVRGRRNDPGRTFPGGGYHIAGPTMQLAAGYGAGLARRLWMLPEVKLTASTARVPVADGSAT